jgi:tetratricopeptide (TPR) repeat protein
VLLRRALAIDEETHGNDHPLITASLNRLGLLYFEEDRFGEAEPLYRRALAIDERSAGPEDEKIAIRLNNLAGLLEMTDRLVEAETLHIRALAIRERTLGERHPETGSSRNNLGLVYLRQKDYKKAEPLFRKAVTMQKTPWATNIPARQFICTISPIYISANSDTRRLSRSIFALSRYVRGAMVQSTT